MHSTVPVNTQCLTWVDTGQIVYAYINGRWLLCEITLAAGVSAKVSNKLHGINKWVDICTLRSRPISEPGTS